MQKTTDDNYDCTFYISSDLTLQLFQGVLQSNGAAPTTWVVISTVLTQMLWKASNGDFFIEPLTKMLHHIDGFTFANNTDLGDYDTAEWESFDDLQESIDRWQGDLCTTEGAIVPEKSFV